MSAQHGLRLSAILEYTYVSARVTRESQTRTHTHLSRSAHTGGLHHISRPFFISRSDLLAISPPLASIQPQTISQGWPRTVCAPARLAQASSSRIQNSPQTAATAASASKASRSNAPPLVSTWECDRRRPAPAPPVVHRAHWFIHGGVRKLAPAYPIFPSSSSSMRSSWLYLLRRSERQGAPVLISPVQRPTARSAM